MGSGGKQPLQAAAAAAANPGLVVGSGGGRAPSSRTPLSASADTAPAGAAVGKSSTLMLLLHALTVIPSLLPAVASSSPSWPLSPPSPPPLPPLRGNPGEERPATSSPIMEMGGGRDREVGGGGASERPEAAPS